MAICSGWNHRVALMVSDLLETWTEVVREAGEEVMKDLVRLVRAESWKMRHTLLPILHLIIPVGGILAFLGYYSYSAWSEEDKVFAYIQVLAVALPLVVSIICSMSVSQEEAGHFQTLLSIQYHKYLALLAKWITLSFLGLGAILLAVCGLAAGYGVMKGSMVFSWRQYVILAGSLWLCSINLYMLHSIFNLAFGKTISMCVGTAQSLVAALFLTGLGEGVWTFFPCCYSGRWSGYLLLYWSERGFSIGQTELARDMSICAVITVLLWGVAFLWIYYYEGRQCSD